MLRIAVIVAVLFAALAPAALAATPKTLPDDATIAGIAVGGMNEAAATKTVQDSLGPLYETRPVAIRVNHRDSLVMPADAGFVIYYDWMAKRAFARAGAHKPVV